MSISLANAKLSSHDHAAAPPCQRYAHPRTSKVDSARTRTQRPSISTSSTSSLEHRYSHSFGSPAHGHPHPQQPRSADGSPQRYSHHSQGFNSSPTSSPQGLFSEGPLSRTSFRSRNNGHHSSHGRFHNPHPPKEPGLNARGRRKIRRAMERAARGEVLPDPPSIDGDHDNVATRDSAISNRASGPEQQTYEVSRFDWSPTSSAADGAVSPQSLDPTALAFMPTTPPRHRQSSIISTKSTTPLSIHASPFTPKNSSSSLSTSTHSRNCSNASTTLTALTMATTVEEERDELEKLHIQDPTTISNWQPLGRKPSLDSVKHHYAMKAWLKAKTTREENETTTIYTGPGQVHYIARPESVHYQRHRLALPTLPLYSSLYVSQSDKEVFTLNDETPRAASFSAEEDVEPAVAPNGFHQSPTKIALCAEVVPGTTNPWSLTREEWDQRPNTVYPEGKQFCYEDDTEREASALLRGLGLYGYGYIPTLSPMGGQ